MTDGSIKDWQLAASSALSRADDPQCAVKFARLHQEHGRAWCAAKRAVNEWVLVDLGVASEVSGIGKAIFNCRRTVLGKTFRSVQLPSGTSQN